jgi:hypothetical protein
VGQTTFAKGSGSNNVYAGRDGEVYRRNEGGDWQKYGGKGEGWSDVGRDQGNRPTQQPANRPTQQPADRPQQRPAESVNSLDRQHQSRDVSNQRAQQFRQTGGGGFSGGGGARAGGGRGGGRR